MARLQFQINRALRPGAHDGWRGKRLLEDVQAELAVLQRMLWAPIRRLIPPGHRLLIVPHGPLHLLPFGALWDGTRYLVEEHEVHYAPSASLYVQLSERPPGPDGGRALVVGVADQAAPQIESEARRAAALLGADLLVGDEATAERFRRAAPAADLIHLACHARFAAATPLGSGLRLADRWLTVRDIYAMRLGAQLVTLSGCETGRSLVRGGDELVGLMRGFFAAGASTLLLSLWRVDDRSAFDLMTSFYKHWRGAGENSLTKAQALREAQLRLLGARPHPAFWAPFRLVGRP